MNTVCHSTIEVASLARFCLSYFMHEDLLCTSRAHPQSPMHLCGKQCEVECLFPTIRGKHALCIKGTLYRLNTLYYIYYKIQTYEMKQSIPILRRVVNEYSLS